MQPSGFGIKSVASSNWDIRTSKSSLRDVIQQAKEQ